MDDYTSQVMKLRDAAKPKISEEDAGTLLAGAEAAEGACGI
jgi:hypothetical protein